MSLMWPKSTEEVALFVFTQRAWDSFLRLCLNVDRGCFLDIWSAVVKAVFDQSREAVSVNMLKIIVLFCLKMALTTLQKKKKTAKYAVE